MKKNILWFYFLKNQMYRFFWKHQISVETKFLFDANRNNDNRVVICRVDFRDSMSRFSLSLSRVCFDRTWRCIVCLCLQYIVMIVCLRYKYMIFLFVHYLNICFFAFFKCAKHWLHTQSRTAHTFATHICYTHFYSSNQQGSHVKHKYTHVN